MIERQYRLRAEARVLTDEQVTPEQEQAAEQLFALLKEMANSDDRVDQPALAFLPRIDQVRHNRVLLIDGARGSGKTALLVTLLSRFRRPFRSATDTANERGVEGRWCDASARIVPVGLLDLHPLPPSTNVLFHVIGRFERVVEWIEGDGAFEREPPAWHLAASSVLDSRKAWQKLVRAMAAGWDGNAAPRRAGLDLDAYTSELEEAEKQRLNVVDAFTTFLDALVTDFTRRRSQTSAEALKPLFVLAIDDADMNPTRSVELLDVIRLLWHPRLAFVLTGDSELFEYTLAEHFFGELRRPLRGHGIVESEITALAETRPHLRLANEAYEKLIPAGHRCRVVPIPAARRLGYHGTSLASSLEAIPAETKGPNLASYFANTLQLLEALPDRLRGLIDLGDFARIQRSSEVEHGCEWSSRVVASIWRHVLRSTRLQIEGYDEEMVRVDERTGALDIQIARHPPGIWATDMSLVAQLNAGDSHPVVHLNRVDRLDATFQGTRSLPRPLTAALMLAADVASDQTHGGWDLTSTTQGGYEGIFAKAFYQAPGSASAMRFAWPLPPGFTLPFYAAFSSRWTAKLAQKNKSLDELARHYLFLVVYLWRESKSLAVEPKAPDFQTLSKLVIDLATRGPAAFRAWALQRAGLLAAPEYGLPPKSANDWLRALRGQVGEARWKAMAEALRTERRKRVAATSDALVERVIAEIDETLAGYDWAHTVEEVNLPPPPPAGLPRKLAVRKG